MIDFSGASLWANALAFAFAGALVLVCGVKLTELADRFADQTGLGEATTGAVFLGALTSLAGSVASVTGALTGHPELAVSNAIGGIAAQTLFLVCADVAYRHANLEHAAASLSNMVSGATLMVLLALVLAAVALPDIGVFGVHPVTPLLFLVYAFGVQIGKRSSEESMWQPAQTDATREDVPEEPELPPGALVRSGLVLLGLGVLVGVAGWVIAETGLALAAKTGIREGLVGALLTSVVTSTPELVTTVAAVRRGALTLAVGGILGGNAFDVLFVAFSDVAYRPGPIYGAIGPDMSFLVSVAIVMTGVVLIGLLRRERHGVANVGTETFALPIIYFAAVTALVFAF